MALNIIETVFVFFSKIYIFFYKEKGDNWKIFPIIIMSGIVMINIEVFLLLFISLERYFPLFVLFPMILLFNILLRNREYDWVIKYPLSRKQKIIVTIILILDFILVGFLLNMSRNAYIFSH